MILILAGAGVCRAENLNRPAEFEVKYVNAGSVYIGAGSRSGLKIGQKLSIRRASPETESGASGKIGEFEIESITPTSAAGRILYKISEVMPGDIATVKSALPTAQAGSGNTVQAQRRQSNATARVSPSQREINRLQGKIGFDYSNLWVPGSDAGSKQFGFILRLDASRIAGTHWNIHGYHRGRLQSRTSSRGEKTLDELINRTYHLNVSYENPESSWTFGAGRLYVPWASSLNTLDGFYLGRKFGTQTAGLFMGTAPDPTSWDYSPDRRTAGAFYNIEKGSFESFRIDSTSGIALSWVQWKPDRQYGFFENSFFYRRYLSIYSNFEADLLTGAENNNRSEVVLSRSNVTVRLQPHKIASFHVNQNYYREIPTFDTMLIGTGLLDKYLFQGISGGLRLSLPYNLGLYADTGRSSRTGDRKASWNYLAGISASNILNTGIRAGFRFSEFDSSFGRGTYKTLSVSGDLGRYTQFELQGGNQNFESVFTSQDSALFVHGSVDAFLGKKFFLGGGVTVYRGDTQDYNRIFMRAGYRFDNRH